MPYKKFRDTMILRDHLAMDRTHLANERTLLAYLRLAIMLLLSAVTVIKLFPHDGLMQVLGYALAPLGLISAVVGVGRFLDMRRKLNLSGPFLNDVPDKRGDDSVN